MSAVSSKNYNSTRIGMSKKFDDMSIHLGTVPSLNRQRDRWTDLLKKNNILLCLLRADARLKSVLWSVAAEPCMLCMLNRTQFYRATLRVSTVLAVGRFLSVRPSVHLSHPYFVSKWLQIL